MRDRDCRRSFLRGESRFAFQTVQKTITFPRYNVIQLVKRVVVPLIIRDEHLTLLVTRYAHRETMAAGQLFHGERLRSRVGPLRDQFDDSTAQSSRCRRAIILLAGDRDIIIALGVVRQANGPVVVVVGVAPSMSQVRNLFDLSVAIFIPQTQQCIFVGNVDILIVSLHAVRRGIFVSELLNIIFQAVPVGVGYLPHTTL